MFRALICSSSGGTVYTVIDVFCGSVFTGENSNIWIKTCTSGTYLEGMSNGSSWGRNRGAMVRDLRSAAGRMGHVTAGCLEKKCVVWNKETSKVKSTT
jgi:hypothetical protein